MTIQEFISEFQKRNIVSTKANPDAIGQYVKNTLEIKTYIPFKTKREIAETIIANNVIEVNGVKKHDPINQYLSFIIAMISAHTNLEWSNNPVADYDLLSESGLLPQIIEEFQQSYDECDVILKMALASALEDNNINVLVGHFLNNILKRLDSVGDVLKSTLENIDLNEILGGDFNHENLAKLSGLLDKYK